MTLAVSESKLPPQRLPNQTSYTDQIEFHRFSAALWASVAKDAYLKLSTETLTATRLQLEGFIERALSRGVKHYREADSIRRRGHL